jgi:hypothetical protein
MQYLTLAAVTAAAGLTAAASALATEGPPTAAPALPNPVQPVVIPPAGQPPAQPARPRVVAVRVTPRRVVRGHRARLRVLLGGPGRVRVTLDRRVRGHSHRVLRRIVAAPLGASIIRLPAHLRVGRYRVTVVALDAHGRRSRAVRRTLTVARR